MRGEKWKGKIDIKRTARRFRSFAKLTRVLQDVYRDVYKGIVKVDVYKRYS